MLDKQETKPTYTLANEEFDKLQAIAEELHRLSQFTDGLGAVSVSMMGIL